LKILYNFYSSFKMVKINRKMSNNNKKSKDPKKICPNLSKKHLKYLKECAQNTTI